MKELFTDIIKIFIIMILGYIAIITMFIISTL